MHSPIVRLGRLTALVSCALALTGCASMNVDSHVGRGIDFPPFHTYNWDQADRSSTGDPRLDNNRFFAERVRASVEKELASRGFEKTTERPDLLVHYHASITQKIDVREIDRQSAYCASADCRPYVYDAGTLFVDLVDAHTGALVWRGWAEGSMDGVIDDQAWMEARIDEAVTRILRRLPRGP